MGAVINTMVISLSGTDGWDGGMGWEKKKAVRACDVVLPIAIAIAIARCADVSPSPLLTPTHSDSAGSE